MKRRGIPTLCCFKAQCDSIPCQEPAEAQAQGRAVVGRKGESRMERHCRSSTARLASAKKSRAATGAAGECWGEGKETQCSNATAGPQQIASHITMEKKFLSHRGTIQFSYGAAWHTENNPKSGKKTSDISTITLQSIATLTQSNLQPSCNLTCRLPKLAFTKWILWALRFFTVVTVTQSIYTVKKKRYKSSGVVNLCLRER